jgi:hypothetical protein
MLKGTDNFALSPVRHVMFTRKELQRPTLNVQRSTLNEHPLNWALGVYFPTPE